MQDRERYHTHISAKHNLLDLKLKEVWQYRNLIKRFTKRGFQLSYKQTVLGPVWLFLSPLFTGIVFTIVFGLIANIQTDGIPQLAFYLVSNMVWGFFSGCFSGNTSTFTANAGLFGHVYFPRLTVPVSNVLSNIISLGIRSISAILVLIYFIITGQLVPHYTALLLIPVILVWLGVMGMGLGIIVSSLTTKYRDFHVFVGFGLTLWMYATPVIYPLSQLPFEWLRVIAYINPVTMPIELFRYALLGKGTFSIGSTAISVVFTVLVAFVGVVMFNKVERTFMDTV